MNQKRREALRLTAVIGLMAATGLISQAEAATWNKAAFEGKTLDDVLKSLGGSSADKSGAITINAPDIAENGAVVPVGVTTSMAKTNRERFVLSADSPMGERDAEQRPPDSLHGRERGRPPRPPFPRSEYDGQEVPVRRKELRPV
jgi:hypothetical protein